MLRALYSSASGMYAQQLYIDTIANNLANVNTTGFKRAHLQFQDLVYQTLRTSGTSRETGGIIPAELQVGHGVKPVATERSYEQGTPQQTGNPLDLAIDGDGFFQISKPDGTTLYTRDGSFKVSPNGQLITSDGYQVQPAITIPQDAQSVTISRDGTVSATLIGEVQPQDLGQIELVRFVNPAGLSSMGQNLLQETVASGQPLPGTPGSEGLGEISQGYLEGSNVQVVEEMVAMIMAQRAYEVASKAIRTSEDMLQIADNLKR